MAGMTEQEIDAKIEALKSAAESLGPDQQVQILELESAKAGAALDEVVAKLQQMPSMDVTALNKAVEDAKKATANRQLAVNAFNTAIGIITKAIGIAL